MEHEKILKQKKQHRFVLILLLLILGCCIGLLSLNSNLRNANRTINSQKYSLSDKISQISTLENEKNALDVKYKEVLSSYRQAETVLDTLKNIIGIRQSFLIKNTSFNFNTGYLSFEYFSFRQESAKLQVRAYSDEDYSYIASIDVDIYPGNNIAQVYLNRNLNSQRWYSFEILKGNIILGGDRH